MIDQKGKARAAVSRAVKSGKLLRPDVCEECHLPGPVASDGRATIHAHHHLGYDHPLDVKWLCPKCHFAEDPRASRERNGRAVLTEMQVYEIRERYRPSPLGGSRYRGLAPNSARSLAREFSVSQATVDRVIRGVNWIDEALK